MLLENRAAHELILSSFVVSSIILRLRKLTVSLPQVCILLLIH